MFGSYVVVVINHQQALYCCLPTLSNGKPLQWQ